MRAKCTKCGKVIKWYNLRGFKMPKTCECGGEMRRAICTPNGYEVENRTGATAGRRLLRCAVCGHKAMMPGRIRLLESSETFAVLHGDWAERHLPQAEEKLVVPAGQPVCKSHESYEKRAAAGFSGDPWPVRV